MDLGVLYFADKPDAKPGQNMVKTWSKYREYGSVWLDSQYGQYGMDDNKP